MAKTASLAAMVTNQTERVITDTIVMTEAIHTSHAVRVSTQTKMENARSVLTLRVIITTITKEESSVRRCTCRRCRWI